MADRTAIEWTDMTWNPIAGCTRVSEGCRHCYAERLAARGLPGFEGLAHFVDRQDGTKEARWTGSIVVHEHLIDLPLRRKKPRKIFVNSMSDLFHDAVSDDVIDRIFAVMALAPRHTFQILTKRPERMRKYLEKISAHADRDRKNGLPAGWQTRLALANKPGSLPITRADVFRHLGVSCKFDYDPPTPAWPLPNVWLGVSVEDQVTADVRIPYLLQTNAAMRFISYEPALGMIDLTNLADDGWSAINALKPYTVDQAKEDWGESFDEECGLERDQPALDLVIMGGESGPHARPMHPDWARKTRDQCAGAGVPFFFKQWGEWAPSSEEEARGNPHSGWRCLAGHPHVARAEELYPENGAAFVERKGKRAAGCLLDGIEHNGMPVAP